MITKKDRQMAFSHYYHLDRATGVDREWFDTGNDDVARDKDIVALSELIAQARTEGAASVAPKNKDLAEEAALYEECLSAKQYRDMMEAGVAAQISLLEKQNVIQERIAVALERLVTK